VGAGGGIEVSKRIGLATGVLVQAQYEYRNYYNSRRRSTSNDQTGDYWTLIGRVDQQLSPKTRLSFGAIGEKADTLRDFWSRKTVGAEAGVTQAFSLNGQRNRIIGRFNASYRRSSYDAPDRFVDLNRKRKENRYEIEAGLTVPVATGISVDVRALQTWNKANLPNYRYKNTLGSLGINFIF
jgi:hypothetical protein